MHYYNCWKLEKPILTKTPWNSISYQPFQMLSAHLKRQLALTAKNCLHNQMHDERWGQHTLLIWDIPRICFHDKFCSEISLIFKWRFFNPVFKKKVVFDTPVSKIETNILISREVWSSSLVHCPTLHRGAFCQFPFRWIYYYGSNKFTRKETGKMHLCENWPFTFLSANFDSSYTLL